MKTHPLVPMPAEGRFERLSLRSLVALSLILGLAASLPAQIVSPSIAASRNSVLILRDEAEVVGFGRNADGELGLGDRMRRDLPTSAAALGEIVGFAAGDFHAFFIRRDGSVLAVGRNEEGQLGLGDTMAREVPELIPGLPPIARAFAGRNHSLLISRTGTVYSFGGNAFGQLGRGAAAAGARETSPGLVPGLSGAFGATCGRDFSVVLTRSSSTSAAVASGFGVNLGGQLGLGTSQTFATPTVIPALTDPRAVAAGDSHLVFLEADGRVFATGNNDEGQLGLGDQAARSAPTQVTRLSGIGAIGAGPFTSFAIDANGRLFGAGSNLFGQLGVSDFSPNTQGRETFPREATGVPPLFQVDGGALHTVALTREGRVITFGSDALGQLGLGSGAAQQAVPQLIPTLWPGRPAAVFAAAEVAHGATQTFFLGGFPREPFALYGFDLSATGTSPGIFFRPGLVLPINPPLLQLQLAGTFPPQSFRGFLGVFDGEGLGQASFAVPDDPLLAGVALDAALLVFDRSGVPAKASEARRFTIVSPAPQAVSLTPRTGGTAGGETLLVRGRGFVTGMSASFGTTPAAALTFIDSQALRVQTPPLAPGFYDLTLTDGLGRTTVITRGFEARFTDPIPSVTAINPALGPLSGGLSLTISGANFRPGASVDIGGTRAVTTAVPNANTLVVTLPPGPLGPATVLVRNPSSEALSLPDGFVYVDDLGLTQINPTAPQGGETVILSGQGFLPGLSLSIGGQPVTPSLQTLREIRFVMPMGLGCDLSLLLTNPGGTSLTRALNPTPSVLAVFGSGTIRPGDPVPIFGTGFDPRMTATLQGQPVSLTYVAATQVVLNAPLLLPGTAASLVLQTGAGCTTTAIVGYAP